MNAMTLEMNMKIFFFSFLLINKVETMKENVELFKKKEDEGLLEEGLSLHFELNL